MKVAAARDKREQYRSMLAAGQDPSAVRKAEKVSHASGILHEAGHDSALIELQLAHSDRNTVRAIYDRSERLAERKELMQAWADLCAQMVAEAPQWSDEALQRLAANRERFDVHREGRTREFAMTGSEWPEVEPNRRPHPPLNRKQRRARAAASRRKKP